MPRLLDDQLIAGLFPAGVHSASSPDRAPEEELFEVERGAVARAVPSRRAEFAAGRVLARRLLERVNVAAAPIPVGPGRAPVWPEGVVGSIAHTRGLCVAAAARRADIRSLGIDAEPDEPLEPDLWDTICTDEEIAWLGGQPAESRGRLARILFSAKESVFKCQYPVTRDWLDFKDVTIRLGATGELTPHLPDRASCKADPRGRWFGRFVVREGWIMTGVWLPAPD